MSTAACMCTYIILIQHYKTTKLASAIKVVPSCMAATGARAVRFAFVGCGTIARHHLGALKQSSHATAVTAVVDVNRERAEELSRLIPSAHEEDNTEQCKVCMEKPLRVATDGTLQ